MNSTQLLKNSINSLNSMIFHKIPHINLGCFALSSTPKPEADSAASHALALQFALLGVFCHVHVPDDQIRLPEQRRISALFIESVNLLRQFFYFCMIFCCRFLETDRYAFYGIGALVDLLNGTTWQQSGMFPRVSLCDFQVKKYIYFFT